MKLKQTLCVLGILATTTGVSLAETYSRTTTTRTVRPASYTHSFNAMDRNGDGFLTRSEARLSTSSFNRLDVNRDGVITHMEMSGKSHHSFNGLDRNRNGQISMNEWPGSRNSFARLDRNGDGSLSRSEVSRSTQRWSHNQMDVNNDNWISYSEWRGNRDAFVNLDLNNDGRLGQSELANVRFSNDMATRSDWSNNRNVLTSGNIDDNFGPLFPFSELEARQRGIGTIEARNSWMNDQVF